MKSNLRNSVKHTSQSSRFIKTTISGKLQNNINNEAVNYLTIRINDVIIYIHTRVL